MTKKTIRFTENKSELNEFANYIGDVSGFVQADLNIYDTDGRLITTSQPGIFGLSLLSDRINTVAFRALNNDNQNVILDESIGLLDYKTTYTTITGYSDGKIYGIVALPFFDSKNHLKLQQREVFADLLMKPGDEPRIDCNDPNALPHLAAPQHGRLAQSDDRDVNDAARFI